MHNIKQFIFKFQFENCQINIFCLGREMQYALIFTSLFGFLTFTFFFLQSLIVDALIRETEPNRKTIELTTDLQYVSKASGKLQEMLTRVLQYVDDILVSSIISFVCLFCLYVWS